MASSIPKKPARRAGRISAGNSPSPRGLGFQEALCGHSGCGGECKVRYCGPTTHLRDHHAVHAARGVAHVWPAAIVTGLAIVLTGFLAYGSVHAAVPMQMALPGATSVQVRSLNARIDKLESMIQKAEAAIDAKASQPVEEKK